MPVAILEQPFLNLRNDVFKAGLDYRTCQTRGLTAAMEMQEQKLEEARHQILTTEKVLEENVGMDESVIALAKVKSSKSVSGELQSLIVVFDPQTMEPREWIWVTAPVQNTVALVTCANDNTLAEYAKEQNHDSAILASKVSDPVLKFALEAKAL